MLVKSITVLAYIGEKILACGGGENNMKCWSYDANIDNWNEITKSSDTHNHMSGMYLTSISFNLKTLLPF